MFFILTFFKKKNRVIASKKSERPVVPFFKTWLFLNITAIIFVFGMVGVLLYSMIENHVNTHFVLGVDKNRVLQTTSDKFLSVALDTSILQKGWRKFDLDSPAVVNMVAALSPAYLRFGGTASDCLIFSSNPNENKQMEYPIDGESCILGYQDCELFRKNFTMSEAEWLKINKFAQVAGLELLFDLNVLLRNGDDWDPSNALKLIKFSQKKQLNVSWQLGNEPNSFNHVFNKTISGNQMAKDFSKLRKVFEKVYKTHVNIVGPDVTRPHLPALDAVTYLIDFLKEINAQEETVIDAVTWHHYNLNGRTSTLRDYIDPSTFKSFRTQNQLMTSVVTLMSPGMPVWITETSDAFGGGSPNITDRFAGGFLWLDKLGTAAASGVQVVARQSIFGGYYALIDEDLNPTPDFWVSVLHKKLVGSKVFKTNHRYMRASNILKVVNTLKFYAHCAPYLEPFTGGDIYTVFGYNIGHETKTVHIDMHLDHTVFIKVYILTGEYGLRSRYTLLNGKRLELNKDGTLPKLESVTQTSKLMSLPPFSMVFWQIHGASYNICN